MSDALPRAISSSQPEISCSSYHLSSSDEKGLCSGMGDADVSVTHCFSQPVKSDNMLLSSQLPGTPCSSQVMKYFQLIVHLFN